jgi:hypothetical protein
VPFDFLKRKKDEPATGAGTAPAKATSGTATTTGTATTAAASTGRGHDFDGFSEEWHLVGRMAVEGRLSDALNKREPIAISDVRWGPLDGSAPLSDAPGLRSIDPYDLIIVIAGQGSLPEMTEAEKNAHKVHKVRYDLALEAPPFRVIGTVFLYPGSEPSRLLDRSSEMFLPVVDARATFGDVPVETNGVNDILINRFYLRGVEQVDRSTGERAEPIPGLTAGSPGNTDWQEPASEPEA